METRRITYTPQGGVCSKLMVIDAKDGVIENVQIVGGCHGLSLIHISEPTRP